MWSRPSYSNLFLKGENLYNDCDLNSEKPLVQTIKNVGPNLFNGKFIRRQSQNMLTQQFSHYEGLLAQEQNPMDSNRIDEFNDDFIILKHKYSLGK